MNVNEVEGLFLSFFHFLLPINLDQTSDRWFAFNDDEEEGILYSFHSGLALLTNHMILLKIVVLCNPLWHFPPEKLENSMRCFLSD